MQDIITYYNYNTLQSKNRIPKFQQKVLHRPNTTHIHKLEMVIRKDTKLVYIFQSQVQIKHRFQLFTKPQKILHSAAS